MKRTGRSQTPRAAGSAGRVSQAVKGAKKQRKIILLEQWVEVRVEEGGRVTTTLYPPNEELLKEGNAMSPPPDLVYRRINFPDGVPDEYNWCGPPDDVRVYGGCGIQRMTFETWLMVSEQEQGFSDGRIGPTGVGNIPRPAERGGCECPACTLQRERGQEWQG